MKVLFFSLTHPANSYRPFTELRFHSEKLRKMWPITKKPEYTK